MRTDVTKRLPALRGREISLGAFKATPYVQPHTDFDGFQWAFLGNAARLGPSGYSLERVENSSVVPPKFGFRISPLTLTPKTHSLHFRGHHTFVVFHRRQLTLVLSGRRES